MSKISFYKIIFGFIMLILTFIYAQAYDTSFDYSAPSTTESGISKVVYGSGEVYGVCDGTDADEENIAYDYLVYVNGEEALNGAYWNWWNGFYEDPKIVEGLSYNNGSNPDKYFGVYDLAVLDGIDNNKVMIMGYINGYFTSTIWNGTEWIRNDSYILGLQNMSERVSPEAGFNITGTGSWELFVGSLNLTVADATNITREGLAYGGNTNVYESKAYYWNGSIWIENTDNQFKNYNYTFHSSNISGMRKNYAFWERDGNKYLSCSDQNSNGKNLNTYIWNITTEQWDWTYIGNQIQNLLADNEFPVISTKWVNNNHTLTMMEGYYYSIHFANHPEYIYQPEYESNNVEEWIGNRNDSEDVFDAQEYSLIPTFFNTEFYNTGQTIIWHHELVYDLFDQGRLNLISVRESTGQIVGFYIKRGLFTRGPDYLMNGFNVTYNKYMSAEILQNLSGQNEWTLLMGMNGAQVLQTTWDEEEQEWSRFIYPEGLNNNGSAIFSGASLVECIYDLKGDNKHICLSSDNSGKTWGFYYDITSGSWINDTSLVNGLPTFTSRPFLELYYDFNHSGKYNLFVGDRNANVWYGFEWDGVAWNADNSTIIGLSGSNDQHIGLIAYNISNQEKYVMLVSIGNPVGGDPHTNHWTSYEWNGVNWTENPWYGSELESWTVTISNRELTKPAMVYDFDGRKDWTVLYPLPMVYTSMRYMDNHTRDIFKLYDFNRSRGDEVSIACRARNTDSEAEWLMSPSVTIQNSPPTKPTEFIFGCNTSFIVGVEIVANATGSIDIDGDDITYEYKFKNINDGVVVQGWSSDNTYTPVSSDFGDKIRIQARAKDTFDAISGFIRCFNPDEPECNDSIDNDMDGYTDYPFDGGCDSYLDDYEGPVPECADEIDNDDDGKIDYPIDTYCLSYQYFSEGDPLNIDNEPDAPVDDTTGGGGGGDFPDEIIIPEIEELIPEVILSPFEQFWLIFQKLIRGELTLENFIELWEWTKENVALALIMLAIIIIIGRELKDRLTPKKKRRKKRRKKR